MRIGLPRALLYYRYGQLWRRFLSELGAEVIVSRKTDREILRRGLLCVPGEVCLPIKVTTGHLLALADEVDVIFFPRVSSLNNGLFACPKMIGIVDIARMLLGDRVRLVAPTIDGDFTSAHIKAGLKITSNPFLVWQAWRRAKQEFERSQTKEFRVPVNREQQGVVGFLGHFYNIGDEFISRAIVKTFNSYGYNILTKDDLPHGLLLNSDGFAGNIRWLYEREIYNGFEYLLDKVDGMCVIVSMGCGPDSLVAEFMREEAQRRSLPFLLLVVDEHTGEAGLVTRVEAFIELLRRRKRVKGICG